MSEVYLLIGGNLDDRFSLISKAKDLIEDQIGEIIKESSIYETEPWGFEAEQNFLNQVIKVNTSLTAHSVLGICLGIEYELGRERSSEQYTSRTMDIDILFYNDEIINEKELIIPHPKLHLRRFTLKPLAEVAAEFVHPVFKKTLQELLKECQDYSFVKKL